ncbi:P-loop containing nucleoside triphosphate hydrolase protein [Mariannaea sp. PMI_226]|nr:P-loop containing nucleoside triphosphate hydrolase protein [Mariannaea sp. PMI_226]
MAPHFVDDKTPICIPFILSQLQLHRAEFPDRPFVIGLNGVQGAGKTTLVRALSIALEGQHVPTLVCSIDEFYLTRKDQVALAEAHPDNALVQHRGEPGTHDLPLANAFFDALMRGDPAKLPKYDKAINAGNGERLPESEWTPVNQPGQPKIQAIILEGWCVGFRPLTLEAIEARQNGPNRTLKMHKLEHLLFVNEKLAEYDSLTNLFNAFIQVDAEDIGYVYGWRLEQEDHLREERGDPDAGMSSEQVVKFVDGYYPAYELYTDGLRKGVIRDRPDHQLRMVVGRDRKVKRVLRV